MRKNKKLLIIFYILIYFIALQGRGFAFCSCNDNRILVYKKPNIKGEDILYLQEVLKDMNYYFGPVNGRYTKETKKSVINFQHEFDLTSDGIVGPNTWAELSNQTDKISTEESITLPKGKKSIIINLYSRRLVLYVDGKPIKSYPVTIGKPESKSPVGEWIIKNKYVRTDSNSPLGSRWMGLNVPWGVYGIHGTNKPWEIGMAASMGCIRLHNEYAEELFEFVSIKTRVKIIGRRDSVRVKEKLRPGQKGHQVMELQIKLRKLDYDPGNLDGYYDLNTENAVKDLEYQFGLNKDGIADINILYLLNLIWDH